MTATPLWWLTYRQGKVTCVLIVRADSLVEARLKADVGLVGGHAGIDAHFLEGHELAGERLPAPAVGRLMSAADAAKLIERIDPIPQEAPSPSVRRRAERRRPAQLPEPAPLAGLARPSTSGCATFPLSGRGVGLLDKILAFAPAAVLAGCATTPQRAMMWNRVDGKPVEPRQFAAFAGTAQPVEGIGDAIRRGQAVGDVRAGCMAQRGYIVVPEQP